MSVADAHRGELLERPRADRWFLLRRLWHDPLSLFGAVVLAGLIACSIVIPFVSSTDPMATDLPNRLRPPAWEPAGSFAHALGTDGLGRDVLIRVVYGARISLTIGFGAALIAAAVGVPLGIVSGYYGGVVDGLLMRLADVQLGFPSLLLYISALTVIQPSLWKMVVILGLAGWVVQARLVRAQVLAQRQLDYIEAARAAGAEPARILFRHVTPNVLAPTTVVATYTVALFIITGASLSFLGLGLPPSTPDWGQMIASSMEYIQRAWWPSTFAGIALSLTVFGVSVLGDWLRDYLDPRLRTNM